VQSEDRATTASPLAIPDVISFPAEVELSNAAGLGAQLLAALQTATGPVIADLSQTQYCDSGGLRQLVLAHRCAQGNGAELRVVVASTSVLRIMNVVGLDQVLNIYSTMKDAFTMASVPADEAR